MNAVGKDDKLEMALKGAYAAKNYSVVTTLAQSGKVRPLPPHAARAARRFETAELLGMAGSSCMGGSWPCWPHTAAEA